MRASLSCSMFLALISAGALAQGCAASTDPVSPPEAEADTPKEDDSQDDNADEDSDVVPTYFAAADVEDASLARISTAFAVANTVWMTPDAAGSSQFNPVYIAVLGNDIEAAVEAEAAFCDQLEQEHPDFFPGSRCGSPPSDCDIGVCYFADQAGGFSASISSLRSVEGFHLMVVTESFAAEGNLVLEQIVLHESFHIFQLSHAFSDSYEVVDERQGRLSGDTDAQVPWWMEGVAEYMAVTATARELSDDPDRVRQEFENKLSINWETGEAETVTAYFENGVKLYNMGFDENAGIAYSLGAWMVAWLVDQHGESTLFAFYNDLDSVPFAENFEAKFGVDYRAAVDDFEVFLAQSPEGVMALLD